MLTVYLDHGEAYGNLGDDAMLLNAVRKLEAGLGPCQWILPYQDGQPFTDLKNVKKYIDPPRKTIGRIIAAKGRWLKLLYPARHIISSFGAAERLTVRSIMRYARRWKSAGPAERGLSPFADFFSAIEGADFVYVVGAANINDYCLRECVVPKLITLLISKELGTPCYVSSQGIGPLETKWARELLARAAQGCEAFTFRDHSFGERLFAELNITGPLTASAGDEAWTLPPAPEVMIESFLNRHGLESGRYIVFHFRATDYTKPTAAVYGKLAALCDALVGAMGKKVAFLPMSYHERLRDSECGLAIAGKMRETLVVLPKIDSPELAKSLVGASFMAVGLSYHLHVFALSQSIPAIALSSGDYYEYKLRGLFEYFDLSPELVVDINEADTAELCRLICALPGKFSAERSQGVNLRLSQLSDHAIVDLIREKFPVAVGNQVN